MGLRATMSTGFKFSVRVDVDVRSTHADTGCGDIRADKVDLLERDHINSVVTHYGADNIVQAVSMVLVALADFYVSELFIECLDVGFVSESSIQSFVRYASEQVLAFQVHVARIISE
jgi:hypothetical protein